MDDQNGGWGCLPLTSLSFRPSLNQTSREITEEAVQEKERAGNKGTSAGIIMLKTLIFSLSLPLCRCDYVYVQINNGVLFIH